ncbi:MAG: hypothetical protein WCK34_07745 [Bacteroidota bacterium]
MRRIPLMLILLCLSIFCLAQDPAKQQEMKVSNYNREISNLNSRDLNCYQELLVKKGKRQKLENELNTALAEIAYGHFCSKCGRSASQIEAEENISYSAHLEKVKGNDEKKVWSGNEAKDQVRAKFKPLIADAEAEIARQESECGHIQASRDNTYKDRDEYIRDQNRQRADYITKETNNAIDNINNTNNARDQKIEDVSNSGDYRNIDNGEGIIRQTKKTTQDENETSIYGKINTSQYASGGSDADLLTLTGQAADYLNQVRTGAVAVMNSTVQGFQQGKDYISQNFGIDLKAKLNGYLKDKLSDAVIDLPEMQTIKNTMKTAMPVMGVISLQKDVFQPLQTFWDRRGKILEKCFPRSDGSYDPELEEENNQLDRDIQKAFN